MKRAAKKYAYCKKPKSVVNLKKFRKKAQKNGKPTEKKLFYRIYI